MKFKHLNSAILLTSALLLCAPKAHATLTNSPATLLPTHEKLAVQEERHVLETAPFVTKIENKELMYTTGITVGRTDALYSLGIGEDMLKLKMREQLSILRWLIALDMPVPFSYAFKDNPIWTENIKYMTQGIFSLENGDGLVESYINDNFFTYLKRYGSLNVEKALKLKKMEQRSEFQQIKDDALETLLNLESLSIDLSTLEDWGLNYPKLIDYSSKYAYEACQAVVDAIIKQYPNGYWSDSKFIVDGKVILAIVKSTDVYDEVYIYQNVTLPELNTKILTPDVSQQSLQLLLLDLYTVIKNKYEGTTEPTQTKYGEYAADLMNDAPVQPALPQEVENSIDAITTAIDNMDFFMNGNRLQAFDAMLYYYKLSNQNFMPTVAENYLELWLSTIGKSITLFQNHIGVINDYRQREDLLPIQTNYLQNFYNQSMPKYVSFFANTTNKFNANKQSFFEGTETVIGQLDKATELMTFTFALTNAAPSVKRALPTSVSADKRKELNDLVHAYLHTALFNKKPDVNQYQQLLLEDLSNLYIGLLFDDPRIHQKLVGHTHLVVTHGFINEIYSNSLKFDYDTALDNLAPIDVNGMVTYLGKLVTERAQQSEDEKPLENEKEEVQEDTKPTLSSTGKPFTALADKQTKDVNKAWTITFSTPISIGSLQDAIYITTETGQRLATQITQQDEHSFSIQLKKAQYEVGKTYYLYADDRLTNNENQALAKPIVMKFKVIQ